jgi:hypothetical protein
MTDFTWTDTTEGSLPDCADCLDRLADSALLPAIHSVAISRRQPAAAVVRRYFNDYHRRHHG